MKKLHLILLSILFPFIQVFSQWQLQNRSPTPYNLNDAYFISAKEGWVVGDYGTILKTVDGGLSWLKQNSNTSVNLTSAFFLSGKIGFIGGDELLLKTTDGGNDWEKINAPLPRLINGIIFVNDSTGYIVGDYDNSGHIIKTTDQGNNWTYDILYSQIQQYIGPINSIVKTDSNNLWAVNTGGKVLKSYDNGNTWKIINDSSLIFTQKSVAAINKDTAWVVGDGYGIIKTIDGGKNFDLQFIGSHTVLNSVQFLNDSCGIVVGDNGNIFITTNGGEDWVNKSLNISQNLNKVIIFNDTFLVIGEKGIIYKSIDKGNTWTAISLGTVNNCNSIFFFDKNTGLAAAGDNLLKTIDGGENWQIKKSIINFKSIFFINKQIGWATTFPANGGIFKTTNSGDSWIRLGDDTIPRINSLYFINKDTGWAVGGFDKLEPHGSIVNYGYVYKTIDGGVSWIRQDTLLNNILNDVYFKDKNHGWIAGDGIIMRTTNSGTNWLKATSGNISSIYFVDNETGYALGSNIGNVILKTRDGGINWTEHQFGGYSRKLFSINFSSKQNGWAVGEKGTVVHTIDAGETWNLESNLTSLDLYDAFFITDSIGWISGENGLILKTENSGITGITSQVNINPTQFKLFQNYPNPFNPSTTISWYMPKDEHVILKIYDILGNEIETLLDRKERAGNHKIEFSGKSIKGELASGVYFYRLTIYNEQSADKSFSAVKKLILMK